MTDERFIYVLDNDEDTIYDLLEKNILSKKDIEDKMNALNNENKELKKEIKNSIKMLETEKETAISKNERIRLDFAITVLKELEE